MMAAVVMAYGAFAGDAYTLVTKGEGGFSYILINQDLDSFKFDISKYGEANAQDNTSGKYGEGNFKYYTYKGVVEQSTTTTFKDSATGETIQPVTIEKGTTTVELGPLSAGTKIGFTLNDRGDGETAYAFTESGMYQEKTKSRWGFQYTWNTYNVADGETIVNFNQSSYTGTGHGGGSSDWDDWMVISVSATPASSAPTGAPLPGALAALLIGGLGAGSMKLRKRRA